MSRGTFVSKSEKTQGRWGELKKALAEACSEKELAGHPRFWLRDELETCLKNVLVERELDPEKSSSYLDKVAFSLTEELALDYDTEAFGEPGYFWRRDGQIPAGLLKCRVRIIRGLTVPVLDFAWAMSGYSAEELVSSLGSVALDTVIIARLGAYLQFPEPGDRSPVLSALADLEAQVASMLDASEITKVYTAVFEQVLLPARAEGASEEE